MEHKKLPSGESSFDALACDGSGNYVKCMQRDSGDFEACEAATRGYGRDAKKTVIPWILDTYPIGSDREIRPLAAAAFLKTNPSSLAG
jgi:hypothetical protein